MTFLDFLSRWKDDEEMTGRGRAAFIDRQEGSNFSFFWILLFSGRIVLSDRSLLR